MAPLMRGYLWLLKLRSIANLGRPSTYHYLSYFNLPLPLIVGETVRQQETKPICPDSVSSHFLYWSGGKGAEGGVETKIGTT
eukprot:6465049-Amphidinium_carterae.1